MGHSVSRQSVKDAVISVSAEPTARFSPGPCFPAIIRLLVVIPFLGKLLAEALSVQQTFLELLLCVRLWRRVYEAGKRLSFLALHL